VTPTAIVAVILGCTVVIYFVASAIVAYANPEMITVERTRIWSELMAVLIGGLVAFISRGDK